MVYKGSNIKWAISMNSKVEEETQKSHNHMIRYTEYFVSEKFTLKKQQEYKFIQLRLEKITNPANVKQ